MAATSAGEKNCPTNSALPEQLPTKCVGHVQLCVLTSAHLGHPQLSGPRSLLTASHIPVLLRSVLSIHLPAVRSLLGIFSCLQWQLLQPLQLCQLIPVISGTQAVCGSFSDFSTNFPNCSVYAWRFFFSLSLHLLTNSCKNDTDFNADNSGLNLYWHLLAYLDQVPASFCRR